VSDNVEKRFETYMCVCVRVRARAKEEISFCKVNR